jgi:small conductance mechanosensitive channel
VIGAVVAATGWSGVGEWLRNEFLVIVMICSGAYLATRIVSVVARRRIRRLAELRADHGELSATTVGAHEGALIGALRWAINFSIVTVAVVWVMIELNLPASAVVPLASVLGAGLGFGAQQIVGDVLAGIFILSERQFGIGDLIRVGPLAGAQLVEGRVEEMTLRVTKLRTSDGDLVSVANGELRQSTNASRDWARMLLIVPLPRHADLDAATARLNALGAAMAEEDEWSEVLIEAPEVAGVEDLGADTIEVRFTGRTLPAQQYRVARELRRRIAVQLHDMVGPVRDTPDR